MLHSFFASWLIVLIVVPFTAPFATCAPQDIGVPVSGQNDDAGSSHHPMVGTAIASAVHPLTLRTGRIRHLLAASLQLRAMTLLPPAGADRSSRLSSLDTRLHSFDPANLRI